MNDIPQVRKGTNVCQLNRENIVLSHFRQFFHKHIESFRYKMNVPSNIFFEPIIIYRTIYLMKIKLFK